MFLAERSKTSQTTESTNVTSAGKNSTGIHCGVSVNETMSLEMQGPGEPTNETNYYTDDTILEEDSSNDTTNGIFSYLRLHLLC